MLPAQSTDIRLSSAIDTYQTGEENKNDTPEQLRQRMWNALNEDITLEELEKRLPAKYKKYLIRDPQVQLERAAASHRARSTKVSTAMVRAFIKSRPMPNPINRAVGMVHYYLEKKGQTELLQEFDDVMDSSPERQAALEKEKYNADNAVSLAAYDRGHMIARLCEPYQNLTAADILNMTPAERADRMDDLMMIYSLSMNMESHLKDTKRKRPVKFSEPDRKLCEHVYALMEPATSAMNMTNLMSNPCYKYLDIERMLKEQKSVDITLDAAKLSQTENGAFGRLTQDLCGCSAIQNEPVLRVCEELRKLGMNPEKAVWTTADGSRLSPTAPPDRDYIMDGNMIIVTDGEKKVRVTGGIDREFEIAPYALTDNAVARLYGTLKKLGFDLEKTVFATQKQQVWDPDTEKDLTDYVNGAVIYAMDGERQIMIRGCDRDGAPQWNYTVKHYRKEYERTLAANALADAASEQADANARVAMDSARRNTAAAADTITAIKTGQLAHLRKTIRKAESIFVKGSPEFRGIKAALKQYAEMPEVDMDSLESVQEMHEFLEQLRQTAETYLRGKEGDGTTRLERKRVRAVRQVYAFVQQQLAQLTTMEECVTTARAQEQQIADRAKQKQSRREQEKKLRDKAELTYDKSFATPEKVKQYYEEKRIHQQVQLPPEIPEVPAEIQEYLKELEETRRAEEEKEAESLLAEHIPEVPTKAMEKEGFFLAARKAAQEEYPVTMPNTEAIDGEVLDALEQYEKKTDLNSWNTEEKLSGQTLDAAKELLVDLALRAVIRNDQYAHPENPTGGIINQLAWHLELAELKKVINATPTMQAMLQNVTGQSVTALAKKQSGEPEKRKLLKIMSEIPDSARTFITGMPENGRNLELLDKLAVQKAQAPENAPQPEAKQEAKPEVKQEAKQEAKPEVPIRNK